MDKSTPSKRTEAMQQILYAIGDIHGDFDKMLSIIGRIDQDVMDHKPENHHVICVGDLVDRREKSKDVIDYLIKQQTLGAPITILKGNHDRMFSLFFDDPHTQDRKLRSDLTWLNPRLGGLMTLASYGVDIIRDQDPVRLHKEACQKVPAQHRAFLENLPSFYETEAYFFTHAGINPMLPLDQQTEDDLLWIRAPFHEHSGMFEKIIVHGHTPVEQVTHYGNRINIDTGAAYGDALSVIAIDGSDIFELTATGRKPLQVNA